MFVLQMTESKKGKIKKSCLCLHRFKYNEKSGRILIAADLGEEYGFVDIDGELISLHLTYFQKI